MIVTIMNVYGAVITINPDYVAQENRFHSLTFSLFHFQTLHIME